MTGSFAELSLAEGSFVELSPAEGPFIQHGTMQIDQVHTVKYFEFDRQKAGTSAALFADETNYLVLTKFIVRHFKM